MRWAGHVACKGERIGAYGVLVGMLEGNRILGRPLQRWEGMVRFDLDQDRDR